MPTTRPPLVRTGPRVLGGVCAGLAEHLGLPAARVRVGMVASAALGGLGAALYLALWALVPRSGIAEIPETNRNSRTSGRLVQSGDTARRGYLLLTATALVGVAGVAAISNASSDLLAWGIAGVLALVGAALAWSQLGVDRPAAFAVAMGWVVAACAFVAALVRQRPLADVAWALFATAVLLSVTALIVFPLISRTWSDTRGARLARAREAERAEIAAHLHDSVLQTLALIRSRSHDAQAVTTLARSQERELREWLYHGNEAAGGSLATQIEHIAGAVEQAWQVPVEVVTVGDWVTSADQAHALLAAAREAITNAARHGKRDVRVFAEFTSQMWEVFVRDRGPGFDPSAVPADRRGVRDSIEARMSKNGGEAIVRTTPAGTEVHLRQPGVMATQGAR